MSNIGFHIENGILFERAHGLIHPLGKMLRVCALGLVGLSLPA